MMECMRIGQNKMSLESVDHDVTFVQEGGVTQYDVPEPDGDEGDDKSSSHNVTCGHTFLRTHIRKSVRSTDPYHFWGSSYDHCD